jgi:4-amino-4-deoxy-L-arabinose transferase-like glycosyltransferase
LTLESPRSRWLAVAAVLAFGLALRLAGIGDRLSDAEGYSWLVGSAPDLATLIDRLTAYENTPPLFYILLAPLPLDDESWIRMPALVPGVAVIGIVYLIVRPAAGTRAALLAALLVAVAPYHVSYSDYARGFMLAGVGLTLALWAIVRLNEGRHRRWWLVYLAGGILAVYSEYDAALFLAGLVGVSLWHGRRPRREIACLGTLPMLLLLAWLPWFLDAHDSLDMTKIAPVFPDVSVGTLRDSTVALAFGEHGAAGRVAIRWGQFLAVGAALVVAAILALRRIASAGGESEPTDGEPARTLVVIVLAASTFAYVAHAVASLGGSHIFNQRYFTPLIPALAIVVAIGVSRLRWRLAGPLAAAALIMAGLAVFVQRTGRELEPDPAPLQAVAASAGSRPILTNSAVVAFYLRGHEVTVDRPFGLGEGDRSNCTSGCIVIDDHRVPRGVRGQLGPGRTFGPYTVALTAP